MRSVLSIEASTVKAPFERSAILLLGFVVNARGTEAVDMSFAISISLPGIRKRCSLDSVVLADDQAGLVDSRKCGQVVVDFVIAAKSAVVLSASWDVDFRPSYVFPIS